MPRIYAACLASYNAGRLYGRWIDAADADTMREEIADMLAKSPTPGAEEYAIHDYDGFGARFSSEHPDLDNLAEFAALLEEYDAEIVEAAFNCVGNRTPEAIRDTLENYIGELNSDEEVGEYLIENGLFASDCPEELKPYLDADRIGRDFTVGGSICISNGHAFLCN